MDDCGRMREELDDLVGRVTEVEALVRNLRNRVDDRPGDRRPPGDAEPDAAPEGKRPPTGTVSTSTRWPSGSTRFSSATHRPATGYGHAGGVTVSSSKNSPRCAPHGPACTNPTNPPCRQPHSNGMKTLPNAGSASGERSAPDRGAPPCLTSPTSRSPTIPAGSMSDRSCAGSCQSRLTTPHTTPKVTKATFFCYRCRLVPWRPSARRNDPVIEFVFLRPHDCVPLRSTADSAMSD